MLVWFSLFLGSTFRPIIRREKTSICLLSVESIPREWQFPGLEVAREVERDKSKFLEGFFSDRFNFSNFEEFHFQSIKRHDL